MLYNILQFVLFIVVLSRTCSASLLWRIEKTPPSYIFGTMHIPRNLIWPYVSKEVQKAFASSTHFYAEIDATSESYWDEFLQCLKNRSARVERSILPSAPGELLDAYLAREAHRLNKTVGSLEPATYHCERQNGVLDLSTWIVILDRVKDDIRNQSLGVYEVEDYMRPAIKDYVCDEIDDEYVESMWNMTDKFDGVEQRDERMANYIHKMLKKSKKGRYFFAVGAAHMLGRRENLIVRLKNHGYKITRLCTYQSRILKEFGCKKAKIMKPCIKKQIVHKKPKKKVSS